MYENTDISNQSDSIWSEADSNAQEGGAALPLRESKQSESKRFSFDEGEWRASCQFRAILGERLCTVNARSSSPVALNPQMRRSRLQRQQEVSEPGCSLLVEAPERGSLTPAMRKKYLKELFLNNTFQSGFGSILSSKTSRDCEESALYSQDEGDSFWALDPVEHAWMLSAVDGNYEALVEYLLVDPSLLTRKDFVSGFTAIHWLAKYGKDETLLQLLKRAEKEGIPFNINLKGSGGLTPLHVAAMHSQYMVVKILIGVFSANTDAMDYNGKRAWQYLKESAPVVMKELLGAWDDLHCAGHQNVNNNSAGSEQTPKQELVEELDETDSFERRNVRWRFGSFRKLFSPFAFFSGKQ